MMIDTLVHPTVECTLPPAHRWNDESNRFIVFLLIVLSGCFVHAFYYLWIGIAGPALDFFSFRQTQTAISAYWAWRDGFRLAYETPVLGFPWSIPFEFPIYQWLMALGRHAGLPLDVGGRLISFGFYIACLWPIRSLTLSLKLDKATFLVVSTLFLCCPLYVFYSRTILIESCALFLGLAWLALLAHFLEKPTYLALIGTILLGSLAVLAKSTTLPPFLLLGAFLILRNNYSLWQGAPSAPRLSTLIVACTTFVLPLSIGYAWVIYSDAIKTQNALGALLTSGGLGTWNFGTLNQRFSAELWRDVIFTRVLRDTFGYGFIAALIVFGALLTGRRYLLAGIASLIAFLLPFMIFTNLHMVHSYYQNANAVFALAAVGLAIGYIARIGRPVLAGLILLAIASGQLVYFHNHYAPVFHVDFRLDPVKQISELVKQSTAPDDGIVVLGQDWSSAVPYYSERKALVLPGWAPLPLVQKILATPQTFLGGLHLGAVVYCGDIGYNSDNKALVDAFVAERSVIAEKGSCKLLTPEPRP